MNKPDRLVKCFYDRGETIIPLGLLAPDDRKRVGSKAWRLGQLRQAGFPVPDGFAIIERALSEPATFARELDMAVTGVGENAKVAVRSSGLLEDGEHFSFAGMFDTYLRIQGRDEISAQIHTCFASSKSERVIEAQRASSCDLETPVMAVLVQIMAEADIAGVAFTANPLTGDLSEVVINATQGTGDQLVAGMETPEEWTVSVNGELFCKRRMGVLGEDAVRKVAALAREVETFYGSPQDIEWAIEDGQLLLLQARLVTRLPVSNTSEPIPDGFWQRERIHFPRPLCPAFRWYPETMSSNFGTIFEENGILLKGIVLRGIRDWIYEKSVPLDETASPLSSVYRKRLRTALRVVQSDKLNRDIDSWITEWQPYFTIQIAELRQTVLKSLDDQALAGHLLEAERFVMDGQLVHLRMVYPFAVMVGELVLACREWFGWDDAKSLSLLRGLSEMSSEPSRELAKLSRMARENKALMTWLDRPDAYSAAELQQVAPEFYHAFERFVKHYGCRALRYEVIEETLGESPLRTLQWVRNQAQLRYDPNSTEKAAKRLREKTIMEARRLLRSHGENDLATFERLLSRGSKAYGIRECNEYYTISAPIALLRYTLLEIGCRLTQRSLIDQPDDVFFLEREELHRCLKVSDDYRELIGRRREARELAMALAVPQTYGTRSQTEHHNEWMPNELHSFHRAMRWFISRDEGLQDVQIGLSPHLGNEDTIVGSPASPGSYTGTVRIIRMESEFGKVEAGDVLVCTVASPVWSILFSTVGAVVTDFGGVLSHASIIAREYGIPMVAATGDATAKLRDGQTVTVNGSEGVVETLW